METPNTKSTKSILDYIPDFDVARYPLITKNSMMSPDPGNRIVWVFSDTTYVQNILSRIIDGLKNDGFDAKSKFENQQIGIQIPK